MTTTIGFLGFGEAGSTLADGLRRGGYRGAIVAFDIAVDDTMRARAARFDVDLGHSPAALGRDASTIISAVVCGEAERAIDALRPVLDASNAVLDINSVAAPAKKRMEARIVTTGARYVDVAVMSNVHADLSRLPLLLAGPAAGQVGGMLGDVPLSTEVVSDTVGDAARIKLYRSLFVKGLEALALEVMVACYRDGVHERVLESFEASFGHLDFPALVQHLVGRHATHGARRADELGEVAVTLDDAGVEPLVARAAQERMRWGVERGLPGAFDRSAGDPPWTDVLRVLDRLRHEERDC